MSKLNYNRPVHKDLKLALQELQKKQRLASAKKELPMQPAKMKFGKYKGFSLSAIPTGYLEWLISVTPDDNQAMRYARELSKRPAYVKRLFKEQS